MLSDTQMARAWKVIDVAACSIAVVCFVMAALLWATQGNIAETALSLAAAAVFLWALVRAIGRVRR